MIKGGVITNTHCSSRLFLW